MPATRIERRRGGATICRARRGRDDIDVPSAALRASSVTAMRKPHGVH
jgi:hypothetical protein